MTFHWMGYVYFRKVNEYPDAFVVRIAPWYCSVICLHLVSPYKQQTGSSLGGMN